MLTADLALTVDEGYRRFAKMYARDIKQLEQSFAASWYRLTSQDMGPRGRCLGNMVPPAQPWQTPLPPAPRRKPSFVGIRSRIQAKLDSGSLKKADLIRLAFQCSNTFRNTDFRGGCNGARIRFEPQISWPINAGLDRVIQQLGSIRRGDVSIADLIVLAGYTALEGAGGQAMPFCGGRVDGDNADFTADLAPRDFITDARVLLRDDIALKGLTLMEGVALLARPTDRYPKIGSLFGAMLNNFFTGPNADGFFTPTSGNINPVTAQEYALFQDRGLLTIMEKLYDNPAHLKSVLATAWTKLMNNDRFDGPTGNVCKGVSDKTKSSASRPVNPPKRSRNTKTTKLKKCVKQFRNNSKRCRKGPSKKIRSTCSSNASKVWKRCALRARGNSGKKKTKKATKRIKKKAKKASR